MVNLTLSYSRVDTYLSCGQKYKLQYIDYIIPSHIPSPFILGGSIDDATSHILFDKAKGDLYVPFNKQDMVDDFRRKLEYYTFQNEQIYVPTSPLIKYAKADIDTSLLTESDIGYIQAYADTFKVDIDSIDDFVDHCFTTLKGGRDKLDTELLSIYNLIAWRSLHNKGLMMLDAFKVWADENVIETHSIQKKIEIENLEGDKFIGYLDFEATMKDGNKYTMDLKTASNPTAQYKDNCIDTALQLHIYAEQTNKKVGYIILDKNIRKKEPRTRVRELYGKVTEEMLDNSFDLIDDVMVDIKAEKFEKNKNACNDYSGCQYRKLCWENSMAGLEKRKDKE